MEKVLNQEEIDAMFRAARGASTTDIPQPMGSNVQPWNFLKAGQIGVDQLRAINALHESFARNLTHSLGAYLRVVFECNLVSVEQIQYRDVLSRLPDTAYLASYYLKPANTVAALQLDLPLAFPIIDLLLGGQGKPEAKIRDVTEIEEQILEDVVKIICREPQTAWQPLGLEFDFDQRQQSAQMRRLLSPNEMVLSLTFDIQMPEVRGNLNLVFPGAVSNALLRKLSHDSGYQKRKGPAECSDRLRSLLLDGAVQVELGMAEIPVRLSDLVQLSPGQVLALNYPVESPATLLVRGHRAFVASAVRNGRFRAAHLHEPVSRPAEDQRRLTP